MQSPRPSLLRVTGWPVWGIPPHLLLTVLLVELFAVAIVAGGLGRFPVSGSHVLTGAVLCGAAVLHIEAALGIERMRRGPLDSHQVDMTSTWTFAAALLLPPPVAAAAVALIYVYLFARVQRPNGVPAYRLTYTASTVVIAVHAAAAVVLLAAPGELYGSVAGALTLGLALLAYTVVNTCLVLGVVAMASPDVRVLRVLGSGDEVMLEIATLSLGVLVAGALLSTTPFSVLLVIPPILVLQRTILVRKLQERADRDPKTGLLNSSTWQSQSRNALRTAERSGAAAGVLMLDMDHFKALNDTHGHLAGDEVLMVVAGALREEVRELDIVGRFGGEEFVVLLTRLPDPQGVAGPHPAEEVRRVGDRIRSRVRELRIDVTDLDGGDAAIDDVTISVGGAVFPHDGASLASVLESADAALYAAKRAGRDVVRMGSDLARAYDDRGGDSSLRD